MTREEILRDYEVNERGIITTPGKFEGEMLYVPHLWFDGVLMGAGEPIDEAELPDNEGDPYGEVGPLVERVTITTEDRLEFPELTADAYHLWESDAGFVNCVAELPPKI